MPDLSRVRLEDVEHDFLVAEADGVELGDGPHHHTQVPQVQSPTFKSKPIGYFR